MSQPTGRLPEIVDHTGEVRKLGLVVPPSGFRLSVRAPAAPVPESQWEEFELDCPIRVKNQGATGSCNGHAAATSLEVARWISGQPYTPLSPWFIYAILCGGYDRGSSIAQALALLQETGTCPEGDVRYGTINPNALPAQARSNAGRFKIEIGQPIRSFRDMIDATQRREPFNFSIYAGPGFDQLDSEGCPRSMRGYGNHAICGGLGFKVGRDGRPRIKAVNSWDVRWGWNGYLWIAEEHIAGQQYFESYSVLGVTEDESDSSTPPVAA